MVSNSIPTELRAKFESAGQEHVFSFADSGVLDAEGTASLVEQLQRIDPGQVNDIFGRAMSHDADSGSTQEQLQPFTAVASAVSASGSDKHAWLQAGLAAVAAGKVAAVTLGGGQGTRLGFDGPKGLYSIGLPSGKSLFQLQAERIKRLCTLADETRSVEQGSQSSSSKKACLPWYIMTSPLNDAATREYFAQHSYFGLPEQDCFFFPQGTLPCMTPQGKIMMAAAGRVAEAPDGNGGLYPSLQSSGALADMAQRGVTCVHAFSVDNALVKPGDPTFIGQCLLAQAQCGNQSVWKDVPEERVGVVALRGGRPCIVEYSELSSDNTTARDSSGKLLFGAGNICNHYYTLDFLRDVAVPALAKGGSVAYHVAHKQIGVADPSTGEGCAAPAKPNGIKLESFIFDVFPLAQSLTVLEVAREDAFAPVKNPPGAATDSPDTALAALSSQALRWVRAAGAAVSDSGSGSSELSPLVSLQGEGLEWLQECELKAPFHLDLAAKQQLSSGKSG